MPLVSLAKGLEATTHLRPSEIIQEVLPGSRVATLSGPSNAEEVALGMPTAVVLASNQIHGERISELQAALSARSFRVYASDDLTGVELGGCLKNIYAIAAGCCDGLKLGDNAKSAMLTRALSEMVRLGQLLGARAETFYGLGGFGDLVATAHGSWSRNRTFGQRIAEGTPARVLIENRRTVVEGYRSALSFFELCRTRGIEAPILAEVHAILYADKPPAAALQSLMSRELKRE
jgi:glycerol-3-phosphate dehydrogenase (NAD(P)+)